MVVNTGKQITCGDLLTSKHQNVADKQYHTNDWSKQPMDHTVESHAIGIIIIIFLYWVLKK